MRSRISPNDAGGDTRWSPGDGSVDAVYRVIERITGIKGSLTDHMIKSPEDGTDGFGEVFKKKVPPGAGRHSAK